MNGLEDPVEVELVEIEKRYDHPKMPRDPPHPSGPSPRAETLRDAIRRALRSGPATARDLSAAVGLREKDAAEHLSPPPPFTNSRMPSRASSRP